MSDNSIAVSESPQSDIIPDDMTTFGLLSGVIVRPRQTFTTLRDTERSYWWLVFGITAVALALLAFASSSAQSQSMQGFTPPEWLRGGHVWLTGRT